MTVEQIIKDYEIEKIKNDNLHKFAKALKYFLAKRDLNTVIDFISNYEYKYEKPSDTVDRVIVKTDEGFCVSFAVINFHEPNKRHDAWVTVYYDEPRSDVIELTAFRKDEGAKFIGRLVERFRLHK